MNGIVQELKKERYKLVANEITKTYYGMIAQEYKKHE